MTVPVVGLCSNAFFGTATLEVINSTIRDNWAAMNGGGIYNGGVAGNATLTVNNSTISANSALYWRLRRRPVQ